MRRLQIEDSLRAWCIIGDALIMWDFFLINAQPEICVNNKCQAYCRGLWAIYLYVVRATGMHVTTCSSSSLFEFIVGALAASLVKYLYYRWPVSSSQIFSRFLSHVRYMPGEVYSIGMLEVCSRLCCAKIFFFFFCCHA